MSLKILLPSILSMALLQVALCSGNESHNRNSALSSSSSAACVAYHCQTQLSPDLLMRYKIHLPPDYDFSSNDIEQEEECTECKITIQLLYDGFTWLGIGASPDGQMTGNRAVIGIPERSEPMLYYLDGKDLDYITPMTRNAGILEGTSIEFVDGQTVMEFTASFPTWGILQAPQNLQQTIIWAHGSEGAEELAYHGPSSRKSYTITNLMGINFDDTATTMEQNSMSLSGQTSSIHLTKSAWIAHGIMAFLAFGIMVPLAISTSMLRDVDTTATVLPQFCTQLLTQMKKRWLYIHVGLNTLTYIFTLIVFSIAVSTINAENYSHWYSHHAKMGLSMFLLVSLQVLGGYFRPSKSNVIATPLGTDDANVATNNEGSGEIDSQTKDEIVNNESSVGVLPATNNDNKALQRQAWELMHHLFGLVLFFFGVWQMHAGIDLYHARYNDNNKNNSSVVAGFYIVWMVLWMLVIIGGAAYKWFVHGRDNASSGGADGVELAEKDVVDDVQEFT